MERSSLYQELVNYQNGCPEAAQKLLDTFSPLLKKYSYLLHTEDAYEELQCHLLSFFKTWDLSRLRSISDGAIVTYIQRTVSHQYISESKKAVRRNRFISTEDLNDYDTFQYNIKSCSNDDYTSLLLCDMKKVLTESEYRIVYSLYFEGYTVTELAKKLGKSRQAINQMKKSALSKLKRHWG